MRKLNVVLAVFFCVALSAQTREVTDSGVLITDSSGRAMRLEGPDGVNVEYHYANAEAQDTSGVTVRVNPQLSLTVKYTGRKEIQAPGLPKLTSVLDSAERTTAVLANGTAVARLEYTKDDLFSRMTLPGHFTWSCSTEPSQRVRQSVEAHGKVIASATVLTRMDLDGVRNSTAYGVVAEEFGIALDAITYTQSPTGALTTARDREGRVLFYIVHIDGADVGFAPNGEARFYDLALSVLGGEIPAGSDVLVSKAWETQRATIPDHFVLTAHKRAGVYLEEVAKGAIASAWTDADGRVHTITLD